MSGRSYEIKHESGRISSGLSSTEVREQVAMGLIERSARIRIRGHDRWHDLAEVADLVYPTAQTTSSARADSPATPSVRAEQVPSSEPDITLVADEVAAAPDATRAEGLSGEHALTDEISESEATQAVGDSMTREQLVDAIESDCAIRETVSHQPNLAPVPKDRHDLVSSSVPTNTGDSMSTKFMAIARKSLAILIGGYVSKHALVFASTMAAPGSKATQALGALPAPLAAVVAAWAGYLLVCGALDEYGDGDAEGFARSLRALAISAGIFIVLTCLIGLAGSVMTS